MPNTTPESTVMPRRKPYHMPRMDDYGYVNQLTQTSPFNGYLVLDSGTPTPPNMYTSQPV